MQLRTVPAPGSDHNCIMFFKKSSINCLYDCHISAGVSLRPLVLKNFVEQK